MCHAQLLLTLAWAAPTSAVDDRWQVKDGTWTLEDGRWHATGGFASMLWGGEAENFHNGVIEADVAYEHDAPFAAAGLLFRMEADGTGYAACVREVERGVHPQHGAWERPVLQLFRMDGAGHGWTLLQESKIMHCRAGLPQHLKVICHEEDIFVYHEDMQTPVLKEHDPHHNRPGRAGLFKDTPGSGKFARWSMAPLPQTALPEAPLRTDWSWVRGFVYVRSNAVNAVEMWHDYWDHTALLDHELELGALHGFNMAQAYLHWIVWDHDSADYLRKIEDFLSRAAKHGLKTNLIFWDDCGHVGPALTFAAPIPGRHNSQMMMNPAHHIRDDAAALEAHRQRFGSYVKGIAARFKEDPRIAFWQLYNEGMGAKETYRSSATDENMNRLLEWTRAWVKSTGTRIPVTATSGGFYGAKHADFPTYHSYSSNGQPLPNAGGGREHLCTETLNRPDAPLQACLRDLAGAKEPNGFVVWELMIGRDNCRFPWGHPDGLAEPPVPFHGMVYPDGHPWDVAETQALLGPQAFAALQKRVFHVEYYEGRFATRKKESITPWIDFDLGDEPGHGSPDASAGIGKDNFSIRWTGQLVVPETGTYTFHAESDQHSTLRAWLGGREALGSLELRRGETLPLRVDYWHERGAATARLLWSGPGFDKRPLRPGGP